MSAFLIFDNLEVLDADGLNHYARQVEPVVEKFGGKYRVMGDESLVLEGTWTPTYLVIIEFPDRKRALDWYNSDDYRELKALRQQAVRCDGVLVDGLSVQDPP